MILGLEVDVVLASQFFFNDFDYSLDIQVILQSYLVREGVWKPYISGVSRNPQKVWLDVFGDTSTCTQQIP